MKLTPKLLSFLNRVFNKDPGATLALRINYDGAMTWKVEDAVFTTTVTGGSGGALTIDLSGYTIATFSAYIASQPGYSVPYVNFDSSILGLSARALLDGSGDPALSNGDHLQAYTSVLWAWMEPVAYELGRAEYSIKQAPRQMSVPTAEGEWLDNLGNYYNVPRLVGENDQQYAARMIASIGKPLGNNVAMESAINTVTGGLQAKVIDAPARSFTVPYAGTSYGLFDVIYSIALDGSDNFDTYANRVRVVVDAYRDAGTHMRSLTVSGDLVDAYNTAGITESYSVLDVGVYATDTFAFNVRRHDGSYRRDGSTTSPVAPGPMITFNNSSESVSLTITQGGVVQPTENF